MNEYSGDLNRGVGPVVSERPDVASTARSSYRDFYNPPLLILAMCVWMLDFASHRSATMCGIVLAIVLIWRAKPDVLLPLLILSAVPNDFARTVEDFFQTVDASSGVSVFGFPLSARLVVTFVAPARVLASLVMTGSAYPRRTRLLIVLWAVSLLPVAIGTYVGWSEALPNWSRPIRFSLLASACFYGILMSYRSNARGGSVFPLVLLPVAMVLIVCRAAGIFHQHLIYFLTGIGAAGVSYLISMRRRAPLFVALVLAGGLLGILLTKATFGDQLLIVSGALFGALATGGRSRKLLTAPVAVSSLVAILFFIGTVVYSAHTVGTLPIDTPTATAAERLELKVYGDRGVLWEAAYDQIVGGPYLVVPAGRSLLFRIRTDEILEWSVGAHNAVLESIRVGGVIGGGAVLFLAAVAILRLFATARQAAGVDLRVMAAGVAAVGLSGLAVGDFIFDQSVGFWFWGLSGFCYGELWKAIAPKAPKILAGQWKPTLTRRPIDRRPAEIING